MFLSTITSFKNFFLKYERYVSPVTLAFGFIADNIMLRRIDVFFSNALLISYLLLAAVCTMVLNIMQNRRSDALAESETTFHVILVFILQFCFGGLFSASFLFYSRSGSIVASWPFLLLILLYILGNELFRKNYSRLGFQVSVFFAALFSYLIFFLPVILSRMDDSIFLLSGIASLIITAFFIHILSWFTPDRVRKAFPILFTSVLSIFAVVNILYFTNLMPPLPLTLKELSVHRSLEKYPDGSYLLTGEKATWFDSVLGRAKVHIVSGEPLYVWSAIFAPTNLVTEIIHVWQHYDEEEGKWVTANTIKLSISGGRDEGFRTYSVKESLVPGKWRVKVETLRGQLIGRLTFTLSFSAGDEPLVTKVR